MDIRKIKKLIELVEESGIAELKSPRAKSLFESTVVLLVLPHQ